MDISLAEKVSVTSIDKLFNGYPVRMHGGLRWKNGFLSACYWLRLCRLAVSFQSTLPLEMNEPVSSFLSQKVLGTFPGFGSECGVLICLTWRLHTERTAAWFNCRPTSSRIYRASPATRWTIIGLFSSVGVGAFFVSRWRSVPRVCSFHWWIASP